MFEFNFVLKNNATAQILIHDEIRKFPRALETIILNELKHPSRITSISETKLQKIRKLLPLRLQLNWNKCSFYCKCDFASKIMKFSRVTISNLSMKKSWEISTFGHWWRGRFDSSLQQQIHSWYLFTTQGFQLKWNWRNMPEYTNYFIFLCIKNYIGTKQNYFEWDFDNEEFCETIESI